MMLGKRSRHRYPIKRTTSMTEFTLDLTGTTINGEVEPSDLFLNPFGITQAPVGCNGIDQRLSSTVSQRAYRSSSVDMIGTGHFLRVCSLCNRRLVPGRDIYMYRGDTAFCSHECRQQQIKQDERNEKCSFAASKKGASSSVTTAGPEGSETFISAV